MSEERRIRIYETGGVDSNKKETQNEKLFNLFQRPKKEKGINMPKVFSYTPGFVQQADLLYLPNDNGYKYALVVCDLATRIVDAEPVKKKDAAAIVQAFQKIYKRNILNTEKLKVMQTDSGTEFKGATKTYFKKLGVINAYGKPYRHRQQAVVENYNYQIGRALFIRMNIEELVNQRENGEWVNYLPKVIDAINEKIKKKPEQPVPTEIRCKGPSCELLDAGTKVRVILDYPRGLTNKKKLTGKFRAGDIRWDPDIKTIKQVNLLPGQPPLYQINGIKNVQYTREQLQVVPEKELEPPKGAVQMFIVEKILDKKKIKGKDHYLVKWQNAPILSESWEPATRIKRDVPDVVAAYENHLKTKT